MSKKNQSKREAYAKKQEEKGKKVVGWIFGGLIILSEHLSLPLGTVKFRLHRARKELAAALAQTFRGETASN